MASGSWFEPFLPIRERGPYPGRLRDCFNGVMWRFRTGSPWRDVPEGTGPARPSTSAFTPGP
ncbi:transposase [Streptomyces sp. SID13666]|uniref:transposase n=1 Tax=Streptomyces sp. SID13666 TaxID=2706054 RepID=UPI0034E0D2B5